jgi:RNA polymerase primary sigma factor
MNDFVVELYLRDVSCAAQPARAGVPGPNESSRERLVLGHLRNVVRIAFDYEGMGLPLSDLINEGNIGLMRAAELFDPVRGVQFAHYAKDWIRMRMRRALSYQSRPVNLPADFSWRRSQVCGAEEHLTGTLHREPKDAELARRCSLELPAVRRLRAAREPSFVPFESAWPGTESDLTLAEVLPDEASPTPDREAARRSDCEFVNRLMTTLSPFEQRVIRLRFGLDDGVGQTLDEVGQTFGYGRQGIHRIESSALAKLRKHARFLQFAGPGVNRKVDTQPETITWPAMLR